MLIDLNGISRRKQGKEIIKDVTWQIQKGEKWMLYGLNGAGKTTLLNILNAYEPITSGEISLFNMKPGKQGYSADAVRENIGFVSNSLMDRFQDGEIVLDVVISGIFKSIGVYQSVTSEHIERAKRSLQQLGMSEFEQQYYGYLSTGERQKVLIVRALMGEPQLLILDEPASGLDFIAREDLLSTLDELYEKHPELAVIYVTHFVEEITERIQKGFLLKNGQRFMQGDIESVLNSDTLSNYFNRNVSIIKQNRRYSLFLNEDKIAENQRK
ncbi:ABC transporter ATP-binding protein [Staphylococcus gallinarum]|uniref:ABC transporter ATP-binding protein n=1 Tax=Staphylococcus gallinarum TaxID=1293 RepID=UPI001E51B71D|nr:ABC transporter ATP-binding protein [Staphylococcus gallinarum]